MESNSFIYSERVTERKSEYNESHYENIGKIRPIGRWLSELRESTQSECLSALQAKSVSSEPEVCQALAIRNTQVALHEIRDKSVEVIDLIDSLIDGLPLVPQGLEEFQTDLQSVNSQVTPIVQMCRRRGCDFSAATATTTTAEALRGNVSTAVTTICQQLVRFVEIFRDKNRVNNAQLEATLRKLKERFGEMVDHTIRTEGKFIAQGLKSRSSHLCLKWSILALWQLAQNDPYMCRIFIEGDVVPLLVDVVVNYTNIILEKENQIKSAVLRVLTHLCVNQKTIEQIASECASGKSFMHLIANPSSEMLLKEISALMVQLTTPFIDCQQNSEKENFQLFSTSSLFTKFPVNDLVKCLTDAAAGTSCPETFMLIVAALANISFTHPRLLLRHETTHVLIDVAKDNTVFQSLSIKDQIITILANLSASYPLEVVGSGGLVYLLCAFQLRPSSSSPKKENHAVATERIQQKVAVALARLGNHKSAANLIHKLNGISRLVELCREGKERNFSDTVLLACLAAIRRLAQTIGNEPFQAVHAQDLLHSDFKKVFMAHSTHNESFV